MQPAPAIADCFASMSSARMRISQRDSMRAPSRSARLDARQSSREPVLFAIARCADEITSKSAGREVLPADSGSRGRLIPSRATPTHHPKLEAM